jgi:hypothetical protein
MRAWCERRDPKAKFVDTAPFETIPAWRIARLRSALRDAEHRGADPNAGVTISFIAPSIGALRPLESA